MVYEPYAKDWISVFCPVCKEKLGDKRKDEIASFECKQEGCSQTEHWFYPGQAKRPGKSVPWSNYYREKTECGCNSCNPDSDDELEDLYRTD